ncbi:MAG TPA: PaaX family transcriptional regulator C-terminal domain-containing protein, partial [Roseiflexaceae bacterium]|nr:PaaX family transcriptional regulator C-terminal domain-containing protein [Roseiflexaceae bacterium]
MLTLSPPESAVVEPADSPNARAQFLILTLFGDYILPRGGEIWTSSLLALLELLGVGERAARSALSRMAGRGWLLARRQGRRSQYSLTSSGRGLLEQGARRLFEPAFTDWDGLWQLVIYSLPESKRGLRHALRGQLIWLGFGPLAPATWISPRDRQTELAYVCDELGLAGHVELFSGVRQHSDHTQALVERCWDLQALHAEYRQFVERHEPASMEMAAWSAERLRQQTSLCFIRRFWLTHDYLPFPRKDPNLPAALLPSDWAGFDARRLFEQYRRL